MLENFIWTTDEDVFTSGKFGINTSLQKTFCMLWQICRYEDLMIDSKQSLSMKNIYLMHFSSCSYIMQTLSPSLRFIFFLSSVYLPRRIWMELWMSSMSDFLMSTWMQHLLYKMCIRRGVWSEIRSLLPTNQYPCCSHCHVSFKKGQHCYCKWLFYT